MALKEYMTAMKIMKVKWIKMTKCKWKKQVNYSIKDTKNFDDYEYNCGKEFHIRISSDRQQGFAGSNKVIVFRKGYGGWILNTPKSFATIKETKKFVEEAKKKLEKGDYGRQVPFAD
jgi:hypothetical protein